LVFFQKGFIIFFEILLSFFGGFDSGCRQTNSILLEIVTSDLVARMLHPKTIAARNERRSIIMV
jgi:hypothetical protein